MKSNWRSVVLIVMAAGVLLLLSTYADAQCVMCRAAVENATNSAKFVRNLNIGVVVLFLPPVAIFCSIFIVLKRYKGNG